MRTIDHFMSFAVSLLPVVQFEHVKTLFESTQSQESKSEIDLHRSMRQCTMTHFMAQSVFLVFWVQSRQFLSPFPSLPFPFRLDLVIIVILSIWTEIPLKHQLKEREQSAPSPDLLRFNISFSTCIGRRTFIPTHIFN